MIMVCRCPSARNLSFLRVEESLIVTASWSRHHVFGAERLIPWDGFEIACLACRAIFVDHAAYRRYATIAASAVLPFRPASACRAKGLESSARL